MALSIHDRLAPVNANFIVISAAKPRLDHMRGRRGELEGLLQIKSAMS